MRKTPRSRKPNPVLAALAKADLLSALRDIQLRAYMAVDGEPDRELLARLFFIIAIGAETSLAAGRDLALTKRLHATLRTILPCPRTAAGGARSTPSTCTAPPMKRTPCPWSTSRLR